MNAAEQMLARSTALRRMGIVEWLPRDAVEVASVAVTAAELPPAPTAATVEKATAAVRAQSVETAAAPSADARVVSALSAPANLVPSRSPTAVSAASDALRRDSSAAQEYAVGAPALRGRVLRAGAQAPILVLALAEKNQRDALLHPDTAAGALLNAMLATLPAPTTIAMIGVERGEPIAVPATILVLGERSARALLGNEIAPPLRGRVHLFGQSRVVVSYHPDEVRQNGSLKRLVWDDLRLLAGLLPAAGSR